jgi:hypothetical protein
MEHIYKGPNPEFQEHKGHYCQIVVTPCCGRHDLEAPDSYLVGLCGYWKMYSHGQFRTMEDARIFIMTMFGDLPIEIYEVDEKTFWSVHNLTCRLNSSETPSIEA